MTTPLLRTNTEVYLRGLRDEGAAGKYAANILRDLGATVIPAADQTSIHPAQRQAMSGLLQITGPCDSAPLLCPVPLSSCADALLDAFRALSRRNVLPGSEGGELLTERAAINDFKRSGPVSMGGSCRLLKTRNGVIALNLARASDWDLANAWLQTKVSPNWDSIANAVRMQDTDRLLHQGKMLGLALANAQAERRQNTPWCEITHRSTVNKRPSTALPRVVDLSSLWAGPLCSHLWQQAGAEIIKVESTDRPDGARKGSRDFFNLLNQHKRAIALDFRKNDDRKLLQRLIETADIVIESSRPRALRQMGIVAEELIEQCPTLTWVSITGYGRKEPECNWIAYGDDAGVAAGLSFIMHQVSGKWAICGDAIADPLTGLHAAIAGWAGWIAGGGLLLDVSLYASINHIINVTEPESGSYADRYQSWLDYLARQQLTINKPAKRKANVSGPALGADNKRLSALR